MNADRPPPLAVTVMILTVSDRCAAGLATDLSGPALREILTSTPRLEVVECTARMLPDDHDQIEGCLREWVRRGVHLILTTGGTGFSPRDVTPEAALRVIQKRADGLMELARTGGANKSGAGPMVYLSRGVAGISESSLIVTLPGSPRGASEQLTALLPVLPHALGVLRGHTGGHPG
jgi:molybdopterin adenylyltransferase